MLIEDRVDRLEEMMLNFLENSGIKILNMRLMGKAIK